MNRYAYSDDIEFKRADFLSKNYLRIVDEFFDITDNETRETVMHVNEADQSKVVSALTNKLYDAIVDKVDEIDYGDIPDTKGDIMKLPNYDKIVNCTEIMRNILIQYKQDTYPADVIATATENIIRRRDLFEKAFKYNLELPVIMYCNTCLAIISSLSFLISTCIEFIKTPSQETFNITLDKVAAAKTKQNLLFINLDKFNKACKNGDVDKVINNIIDSKTKKLTGAVVVSAGLGVILAMNIIPIIRELTYFFYHTKARVSDYFDAQADLLQINAYNLEHNSNINKTAEEKEQIVKKQMNIVALFRKIADKLAIDNKESENKAARDVVNTNRKLKTSDFGDDMMQTGSSLF